jgi:hypothetical protein
MSKWMKIKDLRTDYIAYSPYTPSIPGPDWMPESQTQRMMIEHGLWSREEDKRLSDEAKALGVKRKRGKGKAVILREKIIADTENAILAELPHIVDVACQLAKTGDVSAMKLIMDRVMPTYKQRDEHSGKTAGGVTINISGTTDLKMAEIIDVKPITKEITDG